MIFRESSGDGEPGEPLALDLMRFWIKWSNHPKKSTKPQEKWWKNSRRFRSSHCSTAQLFFPCISLAHRVTQFQSITARSSSRSPRAPAVAKHGGRMGNCSSCMMLPTQLTVSRFFNKPDFFLDVQQESAVTAIKCSACTRWEHLDWKLKHSWTVQQLGDWIWWIWDNLHVSACTIPANLRP